MTPGATPPMEFSENASGLTARGWFDTESLALDGSLVYVALSVRLIQLILAFRGGD